MGSDSDTYISNIYIAYLMAISHNADIIISYNGSHNAEIIISYNESHNAEIIISYNEIT